MRTRRIIREYRGYRIVKPFRIVGSRASREGGVECLAQDTSEFERGRALQKDGKTAEACAAFGESLRLEFAYGTLFNVANCAELDGNLGTAWKAYHRLASEDLI